jgi:hypothetical protein
MAIVLHHCLILLVIYLIFERNGMSFAKDHVEHVYWVQLYDGGTCGLGQIVN